MLMKQKSYQASMVDCAMAVAIKCKISLAHNHSPEYIHGNCCVPVLLQLKFNSMIIFQPLYNI